MLFSKRFILFVASGQPRCSRRDVLRSQPVDFLWLILAFILSLNWCHTWWTYLHSYSFYLKRSSRSVFWVRHNNKRAYIKIIIMFLFLACFNSLLFLRYFLPPLADHRKCAKCQISCVMRDEQQQIEVWSFLLCDFNGLLNSAQAFIPWIVPVLAGINSVVSRQNYMNRAAFGNKMLLNQKGWIKKNALGLMKSEQDAKSQREVP